MLWFVKDNFFRSHGEFQHMDSSSTTRTVPAHGKIILMIPTLHCEMLFLTHQIRGIFDKRFVLRFNFFLFFFFPVFFFFWGGAGVEFILHIQNLILRIGIFFTSHLHDPASGHNFLGTLHFQKLGPRRLVMMRARTRLFTVAWTSWLQGNQPLQVRVKSRPSGVVVLVPLFLLLFHLGFYSSSASGVSG